VNHTNKRGHPPITPLIGNFRIDDVTGCWNWVGKMRSTTGYAKVRYLGKKRTANRVIAALYLGLDIKNSEIHALHRCDNRLCINPKHIFLVTNLDNTKDRDAKRRHAGHRQTYCKRGHEFTETNTYTYRGCRCCRKCSRLKQKAFYLKKIGQAK
jgi:hypothetical protein